MARDSYSKDLHAVLGVDQTAGPEELRRAYLALVVKYHPDRNPGDQEAEERFKDISQAYAVLSDPASRARYERLRPKRNQEAGPRAASSSSSGSGPASSASTAQAQKPRSASAQSGSSSERKAETSGHDRKSEPGPDPSRAAFEEILAEFFKTDKGRDTLKDLEGTLKKAGLQFKMEDFTRWFKDRRPVEDSAPKAPKDPGSFWERLTARLPGAEARARKKAELYDIQYQLSLSPQLAAGGTTVEISYLRDDSPHRLKIKIPAGTKDGACLRLSGQGRLKPDQSRGDLKLNIGVGQTQTVADLWK